MIKTLRLALLLTAFSALPALAETFTGELGAGDATRESGEYMDTYTFTAGAGQEVTITMTSEDFDTYLVVLSPGGMKSENDDFDTNRSQVTLITDRAGTWTIQASAYSTGEGGPYTVEVSLGRSGKVTTTQGRLDYNDAIGMKGEYYDTHTVKLAPGTDYYIELLSLGFDGYLSVLSPSRAASRNDDTGGTSLARVGPLRGEDGDWTVFVTTVSEGEVGAYDLNVIAFEREAAPPTRGPIDITPPIPSLPPLPVPPAPVPPAPVSGPAPLPR